MARSLDPILATRELVVPLANILSYQGDQYGYLYTSNTKICQLVTILFTLVEYFLSSIFGLQGGIGANDPIMWGRSIQLFSHLEHQNPTIS